LAKYFIPDATARTGICGKPIGSSHEEAKRNKLIHLYGFLITTKPME